MARAAGTPNNGSTSKDVELAIELPSQPTAAQGMAVTFQHVTYRVPSSRKRKEWATLLEDVTAYLAPGALTAILGPSGSGEWQGEKEFREPVHSTGMAVLAHWRGVVESCQNQGLVACILFLCQVTWS